MAAEMVAKGCKVKATTLRQAPKPLREGNSSSLTKDLWSPKYGMLFILLYPFTIWLLTQTLSYEVCALRGEVKLQLSGQRTKQEPLEAGKCHGDC